MKTQINDELKHKKAFTLIELIIVITILVILATIAFVSFQNYTKDSRDANRLTTINNISKGLDVFQIKTGFYPEPESKTSFTGAGDKKLHQGIISDNITNTINLSEIPLDPKEKTNYIYSTYGDGKYYQIASEAENITSFLYNTTYAENKSSIVRGNYKFDPSLPSLIVIPNSLTGSSVFDPKVCFVTNGGLNSITSNSGSCLKKEDMRLNSFDNSLVGYWDMETIFNSGGTDYLKDLSGNNNHGSFSGTNLQTTGSLIGKGNLFNTGGYIINNINNFNNQKNLSIKVYFNTLYNESDTFEEYNTGTNSMVTYQSIISRWDCSVKCSQTGAFWIGLSNHPSTNNGITLNIYDSDKKYNIFHNMTKNNLLGTKKWYELLMIKEDYNKLKIYIDQKLVLKYQFKNEIFNSEIPFYLGTAGHTLSKKGSPGIIDEVKIYNRALTDQEIAQQARIAGF